MQIIIDPSDPKDVVKLTQFLEWQNGPTTPATDISHLTPVTVTVEDAAPTVAQGTEVDSKGVPHIPAVHVGLSANVTHRQDGTWKTKRNVSAAERKAAEEVAMANMAAAEGTVPPPMPFVPAETVTVEDAPSPTVLPGVTPTVVEPPVAEPLPPCTMEDVTLVFNQAVQQGVDPGKVAAAYGDMGIDPAQLPTNETQRQLLRTCLQDPKWIAALQADAPGVPGV